MNLFCNFKYELIADDTRRSALSRFAGAGAPCSTKPLSCRMTAKLRAKSQSRISKWFTSSWSGSRSRRWLF